MSRQNLTPEELQIIASLNADELRFLMMGFINRAHSTSVQEMDYFGLKLMAISACLNTLPGELLKMFPGQHQRWEFN